MHNLCILKIQQIIKSLRDQLCRHFLLYSFYSLVKLFTLPELIAPVNKDLQI